MISTESFTHLLVSACGNERLRRFVEALWWQARRSDGGPRRGTANRDGSCQEHGQILEALAAGKNEKAAGLLRQHWWRGEDVVVAWLRERVTGPMSLSNGSRLVRYCE